ncbi:MAG: J domain-containing protein [Desulfobulbaceae bacterium]|nr:J domain-containing protein [Desulfobulbaceae bacterium]
MYLARQVIGGKLHYSLRESYRRGGHWLSRTLVTMGADPGRFIRYPGGYAFHVDEGVEEQLRSLGVDFDPELLERLLLRFVRSDIRERVKRFERHHRPLPPFASEDAARVGYEVHLFDRRRLHYLRYGALDQSRLFRMADRVCRVLLDKSRDEIEQYFMAEEEVLEENQWKEYVYVILDLRRHFDETLARTMPSALNGEKVADLVAEELCRLHDDAAFWGGMATSGGLDPYLVRYLIHYFDSDWPGRRQEDEFVRRFIDDHRQHRPMPSQRLKMEETANLFGVEWEDLQKMSRRQLTRLYRRLAHQLHPDKGGEADKFAALTEIYRRLLARKVG